MTLRVAHLIVGLGLGGAERMLVNLLQHGKASRESLVITMTDADDLRPSVEAAGVAVQRLGMHRGLPDPRAVMRLRRILRGFEPDVLQTWMYHADLLGGIAARTLGLPVVWNVQSTVLGETGGKRATSLVRAACARLSRRLPVRIIACARSAEGVHVDLGYDAERMVVIPNGVDVATFGPDARARAEIRHELGIDPTAVLVGHVGRFHPYKDHAALIRAAGIVARRHSDARFLLVGPGVDPSNAALVSSVDAAALQDKVVLAGPRHDIPRVLAALDVFVLSSTEEGLPNAVLEAMACGLPIVTTDVGDCRLVVGDAGLVVPPSQPEALADAVDRIVSQSTDDRAAIGRVARERVVRDFSIDVAAERYGLVWVEVAAR